MKRLTLFLAFLSWVWILQAQTHPKLYINIVTHNEPYDNLQVDSNFNKSAPRVQAFADLIESKGAKWNFQTCDGFVDGVLNFQSGHTNSGDILDSLDLSPNIEIDPRYKTYTMGPLRRTIADIAYLMDSAGVNCSNVLGGFVYWDQASGPDWFPFAQDTIWGNQYPSQWWRCQYLWGAGSKPPHQHDLNDYGMWKPDTANFYQHDPGQSVWYIGNGCAPYVDDSSAFDPQEFIDLIQGHVDSLQTGLWPQNQFYNYSITLNQNQLGPMLFQKVGILLDSLNAIGSDKLEWALLSEKVAAFQAWQQNPDDHCQWLCGQTATSTPEPAKTHPWTAYPNPFSSAFNLEFVHGTAHQVAIYNSAGKLIWAKATGPNEHVDLAGYPSGVYYLMVDGKGQKLLKE